MHGGSVEARSDGPGKGSEFVVRLPAAEAPAVARPRCGDAGERGRRPCPPCRILVVDDNRDAADSLAMMLRLMGHEVQHGLRRRWRRCEAAAAFRPDVVLLDIGLPQDERLRGGRAASAEQPWGRDMVLVALTGWGQEEDKRRALEAGFDHHLIKPVDPAALEKLLSRLDPRAGR